MVSYLSIFVKLTGVQVGAGGQAGARLPLMGGCRRGQAKLLLAEGQAGARLLLAGGRGLTFRLWFAIIEV